MEAIVLNASFEVVRVIDAFDNFIWTDRYSSYGDFELYIPLTEENVDGLLDEVDGYRYIAIQDSEHIMVIEDIQIDSESGDEAQLQVTGRSMESILDRRIVHSQLIFLEDKSNPNQPNFQNAIKTILDSNVISPDDAERKIDILDFEESTDEAITSLTLSAQAPRGAYVYDVIKSFCESNNVGFRITLSDGPRLKFKLYSGVDRSYDQELNSYVVFAPNFDNLLNSSYLKSKKNYKNVALVLGPGNESERKAFFVKSSDGITGLDRREMCVEAQDISQTVDGQTLSNDEYTALLTERGNSKLTESTVVESFEGEADPRSTFKYGTQEEVRDGAADYSMGDIVQIENEYGIKSRSRVTEIVRSESSSGFEMYPTFTKIK